MLVSKAKEGRFEENRVPDEAQQTETKDRTQAQQPQTQTQQDRVQAQP